MAQYLQDLYANLEWWDLVGAVGQVIFFSRFVVQWIASERRRESVVPVPFWYLSIVGSLISLVYGLHIRKVPIIASYAFGCVVYVRNLMLIYAKRRDEGDRREHRGAHGEVKA